jgi:hypothetical protein
VRKTGVRSRRASFDRRFRHDSIRFTRVSGAELPVTNSGAITCTKSADLTVRAVLDRLTTNVPVRCLLVEYVRIQGPIQFVLGDSDLSRPRPFSVETMLTPHLRGKTVLGVHIGDHDGQTGVHIYQRVEGLDALDTLLRIHPDQRFFAVPLRLERAPNTVIDCHRETGCFRCSPRSPILNDPGRFGCETGSHSSVVVYRRSGGSESAAVTGYLLVGWSANAWPKRFVPRVPARSGSLVCVQQRLSERGYDVRQVSDDHPSFRAQRHDARLGTAARREWIEFQVEISDSTLRGRAWAVDSYPRFEGPADAENPLVVDPAEVTVTQAREALQACGRGTGSTSEIPLVPSSVEVPDGKTAERLEARLRGGEVSAGKPLLNPRDAQSRP